VVGVFIGLQVSNWNDLRQQKTNVENYVERVQEELLINQGDITQKIAYFTKARLSALDALITLNKEPETLGIAFLVDVYQASQILPREMGRDTYDEILAVGAANGITDIRVRNRLASYYRSIRPQTTNFTSISPYREIIRENMPYAAQAAIRASCDDIWSTESNGEAVVSLPESCEPVITTDDIDVAVNAIYELNIRSALVRRISDLDLKLTAARIFIERTTMMDAYLEDLPKRG
jgi:hypothetical protein